MSKLGAVDVDCISDVWISNNLDITNGDFDIGSNTVTVGNQLHVRSGGELEMTSSSSVLDVNGTGSYCYYWYNGSRENITNGIISYASGGFYYVNSNFTPTGGTVIYDGSGNPYCNIEESSTFNFYNLVISRNVDAWAFSSPEPGTLLDVNGNFTINSGFDFRLYGGAYSIGMELAGNWVNNGAFTHNNNIVMFDGSVTSQSISGSSMTTFYDVQVMNPNGVALSDPPNAEYENELRPFAGGRFNLPSTSGYPRWQDGTP